MNVATAAIDVAIFAIDVKSGKSATVDGGMQYCTSRRKSCDGSRMC
jgi:hypothetical protein